MWRGNGIWVIFYFLSDNRPLSKSSDVKTVRGELVALDFFHLNDLNEGVWFYMFLKRFIKPVIKGTLIAGLGFTSISCLSLLSFPEIRQNPAYIPQAMMRLNRGAALSCSVWWDYYVSQYLYPEKWKD